MNIYFPGMKNYFDRLQCTEDGVFNKSCVPEKKEIRVFFELLNATDYDMSAQNQSMTVHVDWMLHFNVSMDNETLGHNEEIALQVLLKNMEIEFIFDVFKPMTIRVTVKRLMIESFTTVYSAFGPVNDRLYLLGVN